LFVQALKENPKKCDFFMWFTLPKKTDMSVWFLLTTPGGKAKGP